MQTAGLAPFGNAGHVRLHLDDEIAGVVEAADITAAFRPARLQHFQQAMQ